MYNLLKVDKPKLKDQIIFEIISWYGRKFKRKKISSLYESTKYPILIDFGFGSNYSEGWINADFYTFPKIKFWKKRGVRRPPDFELDLRYPLKFPDNFADGVYSGHTLEHLYPKEAFALLMEIYRILKPGAWMRINVPDLGRFVDYYIGKNSAKEFFEFETGCEAIGALTQDSGHHSVWDTMFLKATLEKVGFVNVKEVKYGIEGSDPKLIKEQKSRKWASIVFEAQKSK